VRTMTRWMLTATILLLAAGCGDGGGDRTLGEKAMGEKPPRPTPARDPLVGVWLEQIPGQDGWQGWQFEADGTTRAVDMFTLEGLRWERLAADSLRIWSRTARYPEPVSETYRAVVTRVVLAHLASSGPPAKVDTLTPGDLKPVDPAAGRCLFELTLIAPGGPVRRYRAPLIQNLADGLIGRWTAADGSFVDITPQGRADFRVALGTADSVAVYTGTDGGGGIDFERDGVATTIRPVTAEHGEHVTISSGGTYARDLGAAVRVGEK